MTALSNAIKNTKTQPQNFIGLFSASEASEQENLSFHNETRVANRSKLQPSTSRS